MRTQFLILTALLLTGCGSFGNVKPQNQSQQPLSDKSTNDTGINPFVAPTFPIPQQSITKCLQGRIDEIITGNEATTIWYQLSNIMGLHSIRLPHTHPIKIKLAPDGFCYDYFDVTFRSKAVE